MARDLRAWLEGVELVGPERKEFSIVVQDAMRRRRPRWLIGAVGFVLGLALLGAAGTNDALAQDDAVVVGGGASLAGASASDIEAFVNSILAEVLGEAAVVDDEAAVDESVSTGGDINVGGNMGGSVTTGGGMGGGISIGGSGSESGG